jgi:hypothetical protein
MDSFIFIIAILATWRLSAMFSYETGPFEMFVYIRELAGIVHDDTGEIVTDDGSFFAELFTCIWCLSIWIGAFVGIVLWFYPVLVVLFLPFALSAGAVLVERLAHG